MEQNSPKTPELLPQPAKQLRDLLDARVTCWVHCSCSGDLRNIFKSMCRGLRVQTLSPNLQLKPHGHTLGAADEKEVRGPKHFLRWHLVWLYLPFCQAQGCIPTSTSEVEGSPRLWQPQGHSSSGQSLLWDCATVPCVDRKARVLEEGCPP